MEEELLDQLEMIFRARGLTSAHGRVFGALLLSKKPLTQKEIASITSYSIPAVSLALEDLAKHGLVRGKKTPGKREKVYLVTGNLSQMLRNFLKTLKTENVEPFLQLLSYSPKTPGTEKLRKELETLDRYLDALLNVEVR